MNNTNIYNKNILTTKVKIKANQLNKNYKKYILSKLKKEYEGVYTKFGLIKRDSIELVKVSLGNLEQNSFEGNIIYHVQFKADLCNPTIGSIILCKVINLNNFGILCSAKDNEESIIEVIVPKKSLAIKSDIDLNFVKQNDDVYIEIMGKKQELNDTKIKCIGKITKTTSNNTNNNNLIGNNEDNIIIETNDYENIDEVEEDIDLDEGEDVDDDGDLDEDVNENELSDGGSIDEDELSEGGSIDDELSDNESLISNLSQDSKLMD
jgi:DNA-directed RNA polymerase subunit E'/Rpb7